MQTSAPPAAVRANRRCPICGAVSNADLCPVDGVATLSTEGPTMGIASLAVGSTLGGRYVLERLIGRGGFGSVFSARHTGTGQGVAIKTLSAGLETDDLALRRFFQEARVTAGLRHPNTIRVFDFGQEPSGILFLAMELLDGVTLRTELKSRLERGAVFREREAIDIGDAVCRSLAEAHGAGLVHRDLKPDNIFLHRIDGDDVIVKVLDFGIVKSPDSQLTLGSDSGAPGTPAYMSPEQVGKGEIDGRSDLYSLGVVLFSLVTGTVPFRGRDALQTMYLHVHDPLPDVRKLAKTPLSEAFARVLERTLKKDPSERPQDARELRRLLQQCLGSEASFDALIDAPAVDPPSGPSGAAAAVLAAEDTRRTSRRLIIAFSVGTVVVMTLLGWLLSDAWFSSASDPDETIVIRPNDPSRPIETPAPSTSAAASPVESAAPIASPSEAPPIASPPIASPPPVVSAKAQPPRAKKPPARKKSPDKPDDVLDLKI